jgi:hypothetical protein
MTKARFRLRLMQHFSHEVISEKDQCIEKVFHWTVMRRAEFQAIRDTILIVAFIKLHYPESAELWELVVLKTRDWVGRSLRDPGRTYGYGGGEARYSPLPVHLSRLRLIPFIDANSVSTDELSTAGQKSNVSCDVAQLRLGLATMISTIFGPLLSLETYALRVDISSRGIWQLYIFRPCRTSLRI